MKAVQTFTVVSNLPASLEPLHEVAMNLGWINDERAQDLFRRMDRENWDYVRDPARLLATEPQERLDELAESPDALIVLRKLGATPSGFPRRTGVAPRRPLA
jgi:hypothetical protein